MTLQFIWWFLLIGLFGGLGAVLRASLVKWEGFPIENSTWQSSGAQK